MHNNEYILMHVNEYFLELNSSWQIVFAFVILAVMTLIVHACTKSSKKTPKRSDKEHTKNIEENTEDNIEESTKEKTIQQSEKTKIKVYCKIKNFFKNIDIYQALVNSYGNVLREKALIAVIMTVFISIVFLLFVNSAWELIYFDTRILTLDSRLSSGEALELFVNTVLSLLLAIMAWRLDMNLRDKDSKDHELELESKRKRELAANELKAEFIFYFNDNSRNQSDITCKVVLKNKKYSTVLPPYFDVVKINPGEDQGNKEDFIVKLRIEDNDVIVSNSEIDTEQICIDFKCSDNHLSDDFFLAPIYYHSLKDKLNFSIDLTFEVIDNSSKHKMCININSSHALRISSPLRQLDQSTFSFDCDVVSKLITNGETD